jgi:hypothetical protein
VSITTVFGCFIVKFKILVQDLKDQPAGDLSWESRRTNSLKVKLVMFANFQSVKGNGINIIIALIGIAGEKFLISGGSLDAN